VLISGGSFSRGGRLALDPVDDLEEVFGKYRGILGKKTMDQLEEEAEDFAFKKRRVKRKA